jgi:hypothetical protein
VAKPLSKNVVYAFCPILAVLHIQARATRPQAFYPDEPGFSLMVSAQSRYTPGFSTPMNSLNQISFALLSVICVNWKKGTVRIYEFLHATGAFAGMSLVIHKERRRQDAF